MRVLIAEDDAVSRSILRRSVERLGHECLMAADGEEAWRIYQSHAETSVIISDWMMPGLDGLDLCRMVRANSKERYTYFIFLTALQEKKHLLAGLDAGADDYLSKPLDRDELQMRLISASRVTSLHHRLAEQNTELKRLNMRLHEQARRDPLTNLGNRLRLREDLELVKVRNERHDYCALLCDVDHFKLYNDHYGHQAGDEVLRKVAETISGSCRAGDTAYRYGGEEFLLLLHGQPMGIAASVAERLRRAVEDLGITHEAKPSPGVVTLSIGIAELRAAELKTTGALLQEADAALYRAKESGRNRVVAAPAAEDENSGFVVALEQRAVRSDTMMPSQSAIGA